MSEKKEPENEKPRGVTPNSILKFGLERMARHNETLLAENKALELEVTRLLEIIADYETTMATAVLPPQTQEGPRPEVRPCEDEQAEEVVVWEVRGETHQQLPFGGVTVS